MYTTQYNIYTIYALLLLQSSASTSTSTVVQYYLKSTIIIAYPGFSILSLRALDYHVISDQEIIENLQLAGKFRSHAKPFRRLLYIPVDKV